MHKLDGFPTQISHKQNFQVKIASSLHKQNSPVALRLPVSSLHKAFGRLWEPVVCHAWSKQQPG
jgi:hypothetical protein